MNFHQCFGARSKEDFLVQEAFDHLYTKVIHYLNDKPLYVRDAYACADPNYRVNIRVVNEYPWSNFFAYNMFLRPSASELKDFIPEWTIVNAPCTFVIFGLCKRQSNSNKCRNTNHPKE